MSFGFWKNGSTQVVLKLERDGVLSFRSCISCVVAELWMASDSSIVYEVVLLGMILACIEIHNLCNCCCVAYAWILL
jgi:hypothetical protein